MAKLSAEQAEDVADFYLDLSVKLKEFRRGNRDSFSEDQINEFRNLESRLRNISGELTAQAIVIRIDDLQTPLQEIQGATQEAAQAVDRLNDVRKAIGFASSAAELGSAIMSGNPGAIVSATRELREAAREVFA